MNSPTQPSLPNGWVVAVLDDCAEVQLGKMLDKLKRLRGQRLPYLRNANVRWGYVDLSDLLEMPFEEYELERYALRPGDVIVCEGGEPGRAAIWTLRSSDIKFQKALHRVRMLGGISPNWLVQRLYFDSTRGTLNSAFTGTTIDHLSLVALRQYSLPIPPLTEQKRVLAVVEALLSKLDAAVAALERVRANLKRCRASVLKAAVEGSLVPTEAELARKEGRDFEPASVLLSCILEERRRRWEESELARMEAAGKPPKDDHWKSKYREPNAPDTSTLPKLPDGWCWATMPKLGALDRGKSKHRPRNDPRLLGGAYPFIQTGDVRKADGFITSYEQTYSEFGLRQSRLWPTGTLCITIAANIAETGILKFPACFPDSVVGFLTSHDHVIVRFIEYFLRTAKKDLSRFAPATAQKNINLEVLSEVAIPLPPLTEQKRIVEELDRRFSVLSEVGDSVTTNLNRAERLRQSILKWAFEGKLVDQDPNDEPASSLLERIRAQRAAASTSWRPRKRNVHRTEAVK
jgi:type I restriction enzyme, S subunit